MKLLPRKPLHDTLIFVTVQADFMSRTCDLTGRGTRTGNKISHSKRHSRRTFAVNIQTKRVGGMKLKLAAKTLRTLAKSTA